MTSNSSHQLRTIFFGTPEFALPSLNILHSTQNVLAVLTQPDRPKGRGNHTTPSPVKLYAQQHHIPIYEPSTLKKGTKDGDEAEHLLKKLAPDVAVVVAYGHIIPKRLLSIPTHGCVNVHGSLLPRWRGASPIQAAIFHGDTSTGITIMIMDEGMDTGPIIAQQHMNLSPTMTTATLSVELSHMGAKLLKKVLPQYCSGSLTPQPQDNTHATTCSLLSKKDGCIDWNNNPLHIERMVRALNPWPGTYTFCNGKRINILQAHCDAKGNLIIDTVRPEGKKSMSYTAFLAGNFHCSIPPH